ncbi:MAG: hypothetical protein A2X13_03870 [Bacteroidetes bacterium GWC2_33_15]|nr:MAG: hypothetical protein A2X10_00635 [Bacteroidetes bacterium GWA2_33_15]OFX49661.1 MAG: hypothetical protein A2X13_03870 [Bacteroidetes bacterium GWC2_33_15]OFX65949.1 MAG: hypothetical protein A2X15_10965 [Bacteroidetes bacterium GWB2_32_14]OFX68290.1 MAG: hypothetical protein A2X14_07930 [Bacteroidetes bacterium GWD2_33_33]HAN18073.1 2-phosphosulfolactate phosphatase [Bacteroidales bacterium]
MKTIEVCIVPSLLNLYDTKNKVIVIVDIFRATSIICTMFMNGASKVIPVESLEIAKEYKEKGFLVAAERNGKKLDFADFGNSPFEFTPAKVKGKTIVYSTTNGTNTINLCRNFDLVVISSFLNFTSTVNFLINQNKDIIILCSGWEGNLCLEDTVFAGVLSEKLISTNLFLAQDDSALNSMDIWNHAKPDITKYLSKSFQFKRLTKLGMNDIIKYCLTFDKTEIIPVLTGNFIGKHQL